MAAVCAKMRFAGFPCWRAARVGFTGLYPKRKDGSDREFEWRGLVAEASCGFMGGGVAFGRELFDHRAFRGGVGD